MNCGLSSAEGRRKPVFREHSRCFARFGAEVERGLGGCTASVGPMAGVVDRPALARTGRMVGQYDYNRI